MRRRWKADDSEKTSGIVASVPCVDESPQSYVSRSWWKHVICSLFGIVAIFVSLSMGHAEVYCRRIRVDDRKLIVGFARRNVTPKAAMWLSGFASRSRSLSSAEASMSSQALRVRAMSLQSPDVNSDQALVLVALDLIGADKQLTDRIFSRIQTDLGYSRASVRLCFSHTHSGPFVGENLFPLAPDDDKHKSQVESYAKELEDAIVDVIRDATTGSSVRLAYAHYGEGYAALAVNRRQVKETDFDGNFRGDTEDRVPVLWFEALDSGEPIGGVFGYSAHASVATSTYLFHGDYPGVASAELEKKFGGVWLFLCGVAGDQNIYPRGSLDEALRHGLSLASEVSKVVLKTESETTGGNLDLGNGLESIHEFISLPFRARLRALDLRRMSRSRGSADKYARRMARHWLDLLGKQSERKSLTPSVYADYPISLWRIGNLEIVFLGGEPTLGYVAALAQCMNVSWVVGYSDDVMGYVGTAEVLEEGLREGSDRAAIYYGLPSAWNPVVEEIIVNAVCRLSNHAISA